MPSSESLITTRIDDDDFITIHAIEEIQLAAKKEPGEYLLCAFRNGYEYLAVDGLVREVKYDSLALGLSICCPAGKKRISVTHYAHHKIIATLEQQGLRVACKFLREETLSWLYTKHPISDSIYFGAKARIKNDPAAKGIDEIDAQEFGVTLPDLIDLGKVLEDAPLGMPFKYLEKFSQVRNGALPDHYQYIYSRFATRDNPSKALIDGRKIRIAIFGSCVSRDLFEFDSDLKRSCEVVFYSARSSVISYCALPLANKALSINDDGFEGVRSKYDLHKTHWDQLRESCPDVVLVDFIDERIGLIKYDGSYFSASGPMIKAFERSGVDFVITRPWDPTIASLRKWAARSFMERLYSVCPNIVLHKTSWCKSYAESNGDLTSFPEEKWGRLIELNNKILDAIFLEIERHWVPFDLIDVTGGAHCADAAHKWGLSPFHYGSAYYRQLTKLFLNRVSAY